MSSIKWKWISFWESVLPLRIANKLILSYWINRYSRKPHIKAHKHSSAHRVNQEEEIKNSKFCGCFFCLEIFEPSDKTIRWFKDYKINKDDSLEDIGLSAVCKNCDIDSVIGDASGYPITKEFLLKMKRYWFKGIE